MDRWSVFGPLTVMTRHELSDREWALLSEFFPPRPRRPAARAGDKGYSYPGIRRWLRRHGVKAVIPYRKDRNPGGRHRFDATLYRPPAGAEPCVGWLKEHRAVGTRFDKLALHYRAAVQSAMIRSYLRVLVRAKVDPSDRA